MTVADYQLSYNGLIIGDGTVWEVLQAEGIDSFDVRSSDQTLPMLWGVQAGGDFVNGRSIILTVEMLTPFGLQAAFESAFVPAPQNAPTTLMPLVWKYPDRSTVQVQCRVRRRSRVRTVNSEIGVTQWLVQLDAIDPRLYSSEIHSVTLTAYVSDSAAIDSSTGSGADLAIASSTGSGADLAIDSVGVTATGEQNLINIGNVDTYPTFTVTTDSTADQWSLINETTGETVTFAHALVVGSEFVADMAAVATGKVGPAVTINDSSTYGSWQVPRVPMRLAPGANQVRFVVDSGSAGTACLAAYQDAWL